MTKKKLRALKKGQPVWVWWTRASDEPVIELHKFDKREFGLYYCYKNKKKGFGQVCEEWQLAETKHEAMGAYLAHRVSMLRHASTIHQASVNYYSGLLSDAHTKMRVNLIEIAKFEQQLKQHDKKSNK